MSKNLTFKLILDGDSKGLVSATKDAQKQAEQLFDSIKVEADKIRDSAKEASDAIGGIASSEVKQKVAQLVKEFTLASQSLESLGDDAEISAENIKQIGEYGHQSIKQLENDLKSAKAHLNYLSATNATPVDIENAQQEVKELETGLKQVKTAFEFYESGAKEANIATDQLATEAQETAVQINKLDKELGEAEQASKSLSNEFQGLKTGFNAVTGALAALGIGATAQEIAQTADEYKNLSGRISIAVGDHGNLQKAMNDVKNIAIETNSNLTATGDLYSRLTKIGQESKWSQEQVLGLTETINKAIQVGGGSAQANEAAITQLNQALGSGVLRGDEFNSMMEQSPRLAQALADGLDVTTGALRAMAGEGQLTTEVVTKALLSQSEKISAEFAKFPTTIGASIENLKTAWTVYIGEADAATGVSEKVANAIKFVAENLDTIVSTLTLAGQAFVAYKALNIASVFIDKAAGVRAASTAITQETTAVIANTQAQLANATATRASATAKTQLASTSTAVATSTASAGSSIMTLIGRLGSLGVAITALGVLVPTVFQPLGTWIGESVAKLQGYGKAIEDLEKQTALDEARTRVAAEVKQSFADASERARDKAYQLTEQSKALVVEFDALITKGEPTKEALEKISNAMKFDSTKGINDAVTALIMLKDQGKITADDLQEQLGKALNGKDLLVFEANARAAFAGTANEAEKSAQLTEAVMKAALERTGLSTEQLQGKFSLAFQSASNDIQIILQNLEQYRQKGIDVGLALSANLNKAIDTAQTRAELDYAKSSLIALEKQGLITGEQCALGLSQIEQKASQLPAALNPVISAFSALGIKTKEQLNDVSESARANFEVVSKSGQATAESIKQAYTTMLNTVIATGDQSQIAVAQAKAASLGLEVQIDKTGKASVRSFDELDNSLHRVKNRAHEAGDSMEHAGRRGNHAGHHAADGWREAAAEAEKAALAAEKAESKSKRVGKEVNSMRKSDIEAELKSMGYDDKKAKQLANTLYNDAINSDKQIMAKNKGTHANKAFTDLHALGMTSSMGTQLIRERLAEMAGGSLGISSSGVSAPSTPSASSASSASSSKNVKYDIEFGGQTLSLTGDANQEDVMNKLVKQLQGQAKTI